jgi:hypothetical protein
MAKRMGYVAVIKKVIELQERWTRAALYEWAKELED